MKKNALFIVIMFLSFFLTSCINGNDQTNKKEQERVLNVKDTTEPSSTENEKQNNEGLNKESDNEENESANEEKSIVDIYSEGRSAICNYEDDQSGIKFSGMIYVDSANERVRVHQTSENGDITDVVFKDGWMYAWVDMKSMGIDISNMGFKFNVGSLKEIPADEGDQQQSVDMRKKMDMECSNWNVDESKFELPQGINFSDMTELMNIPL